MDTIHTPSQNHDEKSEIIGRLKSLQKISFELDQVIEWSDFYRLIVESARTYLGADRICFMLLTNNQQYIQPTVGVDKHGQVVSYFNDYPFLVETYADWIKSGLKNRQRISIRHNAPLYEGQGEVVGIGWNAIALCIQADEILGLIVLDNLLTQKSIIDSELEIFSLYASLIGEHIIRRKNFELLQEQNNLLRQKQADLQAEQQKQRKFLSRLQNLHHVAVELEMTSSVTELCKQVITLGRSELGFDRLGLFFVDEETQHISGTYGTDIEGNVQDISKIQMSYFDTLSWVREGLEKRDLVGVRDNVSLCSVVENPEIGWNAMALCVQGKQFIGWIAADNYVRKEPLADGDIELLSRYANLVASFVIQKRESERLENNRNLLGIALKSAAMLAWSYDWSTNLFEYDSTSTDLFSFQNLNEFLEMVFLEDQSSVATVFQSSFPFDETESKLRKVEFRYYAPNNEICWASIVSQLESDTESNTPKRMHGILYDITEHKLAQQRELELALERQRLLTYNEFLANISHDLKTPLTVISTSSYLIGRTTSDEAIHKRIETINGQINKMLEHIQDILTITRLDSNAPVKEEAYSLETIIKQSETRLQTIAKEKGVLLTTDLDVNLKPMVGDPHLFERLVTNLIANAINYNRQSGSVTVIAKDLHDRFKFEVTDTGIGIDETNLENIFKRYYRAPNGTKHSSGTGLGLAIVKTITERYGGTIEVSSIVNQGSCFTVILPYHYKTTP
ncbi:MAG: HAMP domain-containing histidine kinase [Anaerolineae bacterium]|nr:HAMP domain-containing histidine kinase [Anaerolineae bacterium]